MIEMNRVTCLLHKIHFRPRQRRILAYLRKYVITNQDIAKFSQVDAVESVMALDSLADFMLDGFDAEADQIDRRIYYEMTGELLGNDFDDLDTSDDGFWDKLYRLDDRGGGASN